MPMGPARTPYKRTGNGVLFAGSKIVDTLVINPNGTAGTVDIQGSGGTPTHMTVNLTTSTLPIVIPFSNGWQTDGINLNFTTASAEVVAFTR